MSVSLRIGTAEKKSNFIIDLIQVHPQLSLFLDETATSFFDYSEDGFPKYSAAEYLTGGSVKAVVESDSCKHYSRRGSWVYWVFFFVWIKRVLPIFQPEVCRWSRRHSAR